MSWDKNTIGNKTIDNVVKTLKETNIQYHLIELSKVNGMGIDDVTWIEGKVVCTSYPIRMLTYFDGKNNLHILREQMVRDINCDEDDIIHCKEHLNNLPENDNWKAEIYWNSFIQQFVKNS